MTKLKATNLENLADKVISEYFEGYTKEQLEERLRKYVDKSLDDVLLDILGLNYSWSDKVWKFNFYNSRMRDALQSIIKENINYWTKDQWEKILTDNNFTLPTLTKTDLAKLSKVYKETYIDAVEDIVKQVALDNAEIDMKKILPSIETFLEGEHE